MFELKRDGLCFVMLGLLSYTQETLKFYRICSLDHYLNKHFQRIVEKVRENVIPSQDVKGTITTKINSILPHAAALYAVKINALYTLLV